MTPKEGYVLVKKHYKDMEPIACTDFGDCFVYGTVRISNSDKMRFSMKSMDSAVYVNKETGRVMIYNPMIQNINISKGKEIKVFK